MSHFDSPTSGGQATCSMHGPYVGGGSCPTCAILALNPPAPPWQTCPVCFGKGVVGEGFYLHAGPGGVATGTGTEQCRSCSGRGIVR